MLKYGLMQEYILGSGPLSQHADFARLFFGGLLSWNVMLVNPSWSFHNRFPHRRNFSIQTNSSSGARITVNPDSNHQSANLIGLLGCMIAPGTQSQEAAWLHNHLASHASLQAAYPDSSLGRIFTEFFSSVMTGPVYHADASSRLQQQQIHQRERHGCLPLTSSSSWAEMLSYPSIESLQSSVPSLTTKCECASKTENASVPGFGAETPNFRSENGQHVKGNDGDREDAGVSSQVSVVSIDMGAGDISHASRPLRPVPLRPMPGFFWPGRSSHKESESSHWPRCWNHSTFVKVLYPSKSMLRSILQHYLPDPSLRTKIMGDLLLLTLFLTHDESEELEIFSSPLLESAFFF